MRFVRVLIVLMLVVGSNVSASPPDASPYTIYAIESLTGIGAYVGHEVQTALGIYETVVNKTGGINGRPVHFEILDDQTKPQNTVQLFNQVVAKHVPVVLGPGSQSQCGAVAALAAQGPVVYCFTPGVAPPPGFVFAAGAEITHSQYVQMKYVRALGTKRLALLVSTDATGQRSDKLLEKTLARPDLSGMQVVAHQHFDAGDLSVAAQIAVIKAAAPQFLFVAASGTPFQTVLRSMADAGLDIPVITSSANMDLKILAQSGFSLPKQLAFNAPRSWDLNISQAGALKPVLEEYIDAYKAAGIARTPDDEYSWDTARIIVYALRKLGTNATSQQIHDFIEALHDFPGIGGIYDFRPGDQHGLGDDAVIVVAYDPSRQTFVPVSKPGGVPLRNK